MWSSGTDGASRANGRSRIGSRILRTVRELRAVPIQAVIGQWHDYIAMNLHECILNPTPEESERIWRESSIDLGIIHLTPVIKK